MAFRNDQVSFEETEKILEIARGCLCTPGDFCEFGCYKGDTALMLAEILRDFGKRLFIYDSFEGLPEKGAEDSSALGEEFKKGELYVSKREVKERFLRAGIPVPVIKKAWFNELTERDLPREIAFSFLDGDFYESIRDSLRLVQGKIQSGGAIIVHDYNNLALPGVKKAVDEWGLKGDFTALNFKSMIIFRK